jgi:ubiquinone/menaquinone biosynthesis C-methylase UbiE
MTEQNRVQWVYSSKNLNELQERYDQWASDYDADLEKDFGWSAPALAAGVFEQYVPTSARVLDAGAGTGLVGVALKEKGYGSIVAMDLSNGMLEEAKKTGAYEGFDQMVLGETLGYETAAFDAAISIGTFTQGHAPASGLDELVRVTKPGGHIVYSVRPDVFVESGFQAKHDELAAAGKITVVEGTVPEHLLPKGEPELQHQFWVLKVN